MSRIMRLSGTRCFFALCIVTGRRSFDSGGKGVGMGEGKKKVEYRLHTYIQHKTLFPLFIIPLKLCLFSFGFFL